MEMGTDDRVLEQVSRVQQGYGDQVEGILLPNLDLDSGVQVSVAGLVVVVFRLLEVERSLEVLKLGVELRPQRAVGVGGPVEGLRARL